MSVSLRKGLGFAAGATVLALVGMVGASSASALPTTTSWTDAGLQQVVNYTGHISWSIDGLGIAVPEEVGSEYMAPAQTGNLRVEKPEGTTVIAAYFMAASQEGAEATVTAPTDMTLNGDTVVFTHDAHTTGDNLWNNHLADVTDMLKPTIDAAGAGIITVAVDEGANYEVYEGTALMVIFENPAVPIASIVLYFGTSNNAGDSFSLGFSSLSEPQTQDLQMSIGSAYSYQNDSDTQATDISVNGTALTDRAGDFDDCSGYNAAAPDNECPDGALFTVGGIGDSLENPATPLLGDNWDTWTPAVDDELYSLSPFVVPGSEALEVTTRNESGDDNVFMAAFYLKLIAVDGATVVGAFTGEVPAEEAAPTLAETGANAVPFLAGAALLTLIGAAALISARRQRA